ERLDDSLRLVDETVGLIRNVMAELRPPMLDDYGLPPTLRWLGEQFQNRTGVAVVVSAPNSENRLPAAAETALFRIAQEALNNTGKHAHATHVDIVLEAVRSLTRLTIADDGAGFDPAALQPRSDVHGWGTIHMRERAEAVGGRLRIESSVGKGTRVVVEVET
ncbi:MAG TPA: ATP-binding protein, partial [Anaerolineales bacterium]|nr:ATP-binding protein [Anaerolineales bacterium]